jgi:hypothetical protein
MNPSRVEVTIDELVLHGFAPGDRYAIAEALQGELARLLSERGVPAAWSLSGAVERGNGRSFVATPGGNGIDVGMKAAQVVYGEDPS